MEQRGERLGIRIAFDDERKERDRGDRDEQDRPETLGREDVADESLLEGFARIDVSPLDGLSGNVRVESAAWTPRVGLRLRSRVRRAAASMENQVVGGKYRVVRQLGQGGMGAVYEATHLGTGRRVALKVIVAEMLQKGGDIVARFEREARASGSIDSQHVVQVLDTGVDEVTKNPFMVMEYLSGSDLQQHIEKQGVLAPDLALRVVAQACLGLQRAHEAGVVHRDIKTANIYLSRRDRGEILVKILDFGIAKVRADQFAAKEDHALTRTGSMLGSPLYMSPEQAMGAKGLDAKSDIWSLGVVMYEALAACTPHGHCETIGTLIMSICSGRTTSIQQMAAWVSPEIATIVHKALQQNPADRYGSAAEMHSAIAALLPEAPSLHESMLVPMAEENKRIVAARLPPTNGVVGPMPATPQAQAAWSAETHGVPPSDGSAGAPAPSSSPRLAAATVLGPPEDKAAAASSSSGVRAPDSSPDAFMATAEAVSAAPRSPALHGQTGDPFSRTNRDDPPQKTAAGTRRFAMIAAAAALTVAAVVGVGVTKLRGPVASATTSDVPAVSASTESHASPPASIGSMSTSAESDGGTAAAGASYAATSSAAIDAGKAAPLKTTGAGAKLVVPLAGSAARVPPTSPPSAASAPSPLPSPARPTGGVATQVPF